MSVWRWVCELWQTASGSVAPPLLTAAVLLAGDRSRWFPSGEGEGLGILWDVMRVAAIHFLWVAREDGPSPAPARGVTARLVAFLRRRLGEDILRVTEWRRLRGVVGVAHMRDRPLLDSGVFEGRWCRGGVLCVMVGSCYLIRLTTSFPVHIP